MCVGLVLMVLIDLLCCGGRSAVSLEQCQSPGACLLVTVLDYDALRSDDFEGEVFLSLKAVPGVAGGGGSTDPNPAQIRLPLMHPKPNSTNFLSLITLTHVLMARSH